MRAYLGYCLFAACCLLLGGCGGGGKSDPPVAEGEAAPTSTKFTITVDTPAGLSTANHHLPSLISKAYAEAQTTLNEQNFAAVWLDGKGNVLEQIEITSWENMDNGTYVIEAGTRIRLNAVLLIDLFTTPVFTVGEALPSNLYMVPLAEDRMTVNLKSSLAFYALAQRVVQDESWGIFEETILEPSRNKVFQAQQDLNTIADDLEATLLPQVGLQNLRLRDLLSLSLVKGMLEGRMERFVAEQNAVKANIEEILTDGYWTVSTFSSNDGSGILSDKMTYDGQETSYTEYRWDKNGDEDISLNEFFNYLSGSTTFGSEDIKHQILTADGWTGLFDYLKVEVSTAASMLLTDAALEKEDEAGIMLEANVYPLANKKMHDFLSSKDNYSVTRYIKPDEQFSDTAFGFYFTWRPENETYLLCDNRNDNPACRISPQSQPGTYYTSLADVRTPSDSVAITIDDVNGFKLADNVIVEVIDDNNFTARYWVNIAANNWNVQETSVWAPTSVAGKSMIRLEVPQNIKKLAANYAFEHRNLFLVEDRGFVNIGETLLDGETFHFSGFDNNAKAQIFAAASRSNLPPFGSCTFGNSLPANEDNYLNAVTECGGDERFTTQAINSLLEQHLVQVSEEGDVAAIILANDNTWKFYDNSVLQDANREWELTQEGYLKLTPNVSQPENFDYWAQTNLDRSQGILAIKGYSTRTDSSNTVSNELFNLMTKEYAPDQLTACIDQDSGWDASTTTPIDKKNLDQYNDQTSQCKIIWQQREPRFTDAMLIGQSGDNSDDMALRFEDDSSRYLQLSDNFEGDFFLGNYIDEDGCKFNIPVKWKIEESGTLYYEATDGSLNERITITDSDGLRFAIKAFNHQTRWQDDETLLYTAGEGEIWSDIITLIDASGVPNVEHMELLNNPAPPAEGKEVAGTVLNDGLECAPPAPGPEPTP
ncbi:hydrogenase expression protein HypA [Photobacterium sp. SDRW27]|uniref:hydrogenase expression protein HypA n=1 Tax=Photobacterium obscurum TaxID=2829490 RepID=UPI002243A063|nr:hydrogenase expression protein HypA [Photobacterium obscurum]MCW8327238.1 hydrogenase expression protein HypA [Photobacterium obscurum]